MHHDHNDADPIDTKLPTYLAPEYGDNVLRSALIEFALRRIEHNRTSGLTEQVAALLTERRVAMAAFLFNTWLTPTPDPGTDRVFQQLHQLALRKLEEAGLTVVDMYPAAQQLMAKERWSNRRNFWVDVRVDGRPKPRGREFIAALLDDSLRDTEPGRTLLQRRRD